MGRGKNWSAEENEHLARAWLAASEDPVVGADQTRKVFKESVRRRFLQMSPTDSNAKEGRYGSRSVASIDQHFSELSADVQKFRAALGKIKASGPTGVSDQEKHAMAIAIHCGKTSVMEYNYKDIDCMETWSGYKAWLVLQNHPKWCDVPNPVSSVADETADIPPQASDVTSNTQSDRHDDVSNEEERVEKKKNRYPVGVKAAKVARQEEIRTASVKRLADAAQRKSDVLEERNAIAVFSRPEMAGTPEAVSFFTAIGRIHLARAQKRAKLEANDEDDLLVDASEVTNSRTLPSTEELGDGDATSRL